MASNASESPISSLFEGMILFSPSDLLPSSSPEQKQPSLSTPLDQHFFSQHPNPSISRKKKRSSRIGYSREAIDSSEKPAKEGDKLEAIDSSEKPAKEGYKLELTEERLNLVRSSICTKYEGIKKTAALAYSDRKELERRRRKAEQDVSKAAMMYKELEQQLEVACEAEDFESAEKVSELLAAAEEEKDMLLNALREREMDCDCFDLGMQDVFGLQIAAEEEGVVCLEKFAKVFGFVYFDSC